MNTRFTYMWLTATLVLLYISSCRADPHVQWSFTKFMIQNVKCAVDKEYIKFSYDFSTLCGPVPEYKTNCLKQTRPEPGTGTPYTGGGPYLSMKLDKDNNDIAFQSTTEWLPPFWAEIHYKSTGAPGIPSTFNFRKEGQPGLGEIDFIVASIKTDKGMLKHFISTPLYTLDGNNGLRKLRTMGPDREVEVLLAEGTDYATDISAKSDTFAGNAAEIDSYFDLNWGITWEGFDPASEGNIYAIKWTDTSIEWYAGSKDNVPLRITLKKVPFGETFPKGPLPITLGPWATQGEWADTVDWTKYQNPTMTLSKLDVQGCKTQ